jgi:phage-related protein
MKLLRLGCHRWEVVAILADDEKTCEALDFLLGKRLGQPASRRAMFSFLKEVVTRHGPPEANPETCLRLKPYERHLYEFRKQPQRGPKVRVVWFYDREEKRVVCVNGFLKTNETPERKLEEAEAARARYFADKAKDKLVVLDLDIEE